MREPLLLFCARMETAKGPSDRPRNGILKSGLGAFLVRGGLWAGSGRVVAALFGFLGNILLARLLDPEAYGAYFMALGVVTLAATVGVLGLDRTAVRLLATAVAEERSESLRDLVGKFVGLALVGGIVVAGLFLACSRLLLVDGLKMPILEASSFVLCLWIVATVLQRLLAEIFRGLQDIRLATLFSGLRLGGLLLSMFLFFGLAAFQMLGIKGLAAVLWLIVSLIGILVLTASVVLRRQLEVRRAIDGDAADPIAADGPGYGTRKILGVALPLLLAGLLVNARTSGDVLVLGAFSDAGNAALYGVSIRILALVVTPLMVVNAVLAPLVARLHARGERQALERAVRVAATTASYLAISVFVLIGASGEWILAIGFGEFYRDALPVLLILVVGQLANVLAGPNLLVLMMTGHHRVALAGTALSAAFVLVVATLLAPAHGAGGVALAAAGGILLQNAFLIVRVRRLVGISTHVMLSPRALRQAISSLELR